MKIRLVYVHFEKCLIPRSFDVICHHWLCFTNISNIIHILVKYEICLSLQYINYYFIGRRCYYTSYVTDLKEWNQY